MSLLEPDLPWIVFPSVVSILQAATLVRPPMCRVIARSAWRDSFQQKVKCPLRVLLSLSPVTTILGLAFRTIGSAAFILESAGNIRFTTWSLFNFPFHSFRVHTEHQREDLGDGHIRSVESLGFPSMIIVNIIKSYDSARFHS